MMAYKFSALLMAALLPAALWAQSQSFSLSEALQYGVEHNTKVQSAALDVEDAQATVDNRISSGLPQINGSIDYQNFFKLPTSLIPAEFFGGEPGDFIPVQFGTEQNVTVGISASQLIFNGAWLVGVSAARTYVGLVESQQKLSEQEVKQNVETAYYSVLIAKEFESLLQKNIDNLNKVYVEVDAMLKQGFVEEIDLDRLTISKATLETQLANAKRQTGVAEAYLKFSMGLDMATPITLTDALPSMQDADDAAVNANNYLNRPEFTILNTLVALNEYNVRVNKAMYLPTVALYGQYNTNAQRNAFNFFSSGEPWFQVGLVGVKMDIPIFSGMQRQSNVTSAQVGLEKARLDQQNATQGILLEIQKTQTDYTNAIADLETQQKNIELAQKIYNTALIKYREGVGSSLELNNAESTLYGAQGNYIASLYNVLTAKTALTKSLGNY
ncbi:MAG: TolC family protein [Chitinophagales bacterium]